MELKHGKLARKSEPARMPLKPALAGLGGHGQLMGISHKEFAAAAKSLEERQGRPGDNPGTRQTPTFEWV